jgi:hypothetical protein
MYSFNSKLWIQSWIIFFCVMPLSIGESSKPESAEGLAVQEFSTENGLKLSKKAVESLELKDLAIQSLDSLSKIPLSSIVYFGAKVGVYRLRNGWYKLIPIEIAKKSEGFCQIKTAEVRPGDRVVIQGVDLLRVAEMEALSAGEDP